MEVSKLVQDEIDLSLELSIGGIFRKFEKSKHQQIQHKSISSSITFEAESCEINDADLRRESEKFLCKYSSFGGGGGEVDALDLKQKMKREIQALRRQEARKKTEEKRKRRRNFILKNENEGSERYDYGNQTLDGTNLPAFGSHPPCSMIPTFGNRFVFPYHMMSYWAEPECDLLEKNGLKLVKVQQSSKSLGSGSSSVSDHHNGESNTSSDTITSLPHYSAISNAQGKSEHTDSSDPKVVSSNTQSSSPRQADDDEEPNCLSNPHDPINKTISITKNPFPVPPTSSTTQSRRSMVDHTTNAYQTQSLTHMPCVSTTGNGPNGKTINGFLYRYNTKTEVSIMCVCHGSSFTPAQFVKHAGGNNMDVSHPMKHIFVSPSNKLS